MHNSLVASDIGERISGVVSAFWGIIPGAATTLTFAVWTTSYRALAGFCLESNESAYPTGTTRAATSAANRRTRCRFRIAPYLFLPACDLTPAQQGRQADRQTAAGDTSSDVPRRFRGVEVRRTMMPGRHASVTSRFRTACGDRAGGRFSTMRNNDGTSFHKLGHAKPLKRLCYAHR